MPSTFSWLDHSEHDRRRVLDAIDQFKEAETRDELGLGNIRDAFADLLFPGTSTIQTRARYFLFIPWMYLDLHNRGMDRSNVVARARKEEIRLRDALLESADDSGTIGKVAGAALKRLPSNVYWQGLGAWNIRKFHGSQDEYHRYFDLFYQDDRSNRDDDGERLEGGAREAWHSYVPPAPENFPDEAEFALRPEEAQYLAERICFSAPLSLLAFLVRRGSRAEAPFIWAHPEFGAFPQEIRFILHHARLLSEAMHGAALLYNLMLSEQLPSGARRDENLEYFDKALTDWSEELSARHDDFARWDKKEFWALVQRHTWVSGSTQQFVDRWTASKPWVTSSRTAENAHLRTLIRDRERHLKGARARLGNSRALELWNGASGTVRLNYRWPSAARILADIHEGLEATRAVA